MRQGELCWVAGTVYMDMPLKPNILDDISKDVRSESAIDSLFNRLIICIVALDSGSSTA